MISPTDAVAFLPPTFQIFTGLSFFLAALLVVVGFVVAARRSAEVGLA